MKNSPIFYMGCKRRLIQKGLCDLFPSDINTFVDIFSGSGIVSMNVNAQKYIVNDIDIHLQDLYRLFRTFNAEEIIQSADEIIDSYGLPREETRRCNYSDKDKIAQYKAAYHKLRDDFNRTHNLMSFYTLMLFSFSQQFRYNNKGDFNMPFGNDYFRDVYKEYIEDGCNFFSGMNVAIYNKDFRNVVDRHYKDKDCFFYCDPPYIDSTAVYNERYNGWKENDLEDLLNLLCLIDNEGQKFALSSVIKNKGKENVQLIQWLNDTGYKVHNFSNFNYTACGKGNAKTQEALITNY